MARVRRHEIHADFALLTRGLVEFGPPVQLQVVEQLVDRGLDSGSKTR